MDKDYNRNIKLRCAVCGDDTSFEFNEDKSYVKCTRCGREYFGGYNEVVELNQELVETELEDIEKEVTIDLKNDLNKVFKDAFRGNKYIKFK
jgi:DNA-directed RNA polymerase subunit RPC12/RpoP